jgi:hypothetical protein
VTTIAPPPLAPAAAPPPLSPGGRTAVRVLTVVAAAALVAGCVLSLGSVAWGLSSYRVIADAKTLPAGMKSLIIDTGEIPTAVRITADSNAREPRVTMRLINSNRAGEHSLVVTDDAGATRLTLVGERSSLPDFGRAGELNVTLPPDLARKLSVTTQQETGVLLAQTDLDQIVVHNTDGDVVLSSGVESRSTPGTATSWPGSRSRLPRHSSPRWWTATSPSTSRTPRRARWMWSPATVT